MSITQSSEFFINMKDVPKWNRNKHYFEQSQDALEFFTEERRKITEGININGTFIHPWLYFHLNFFITPIPTADKKELPMNPPLRDNEWFFTENYMRAEKEGKGLAMFGTRRFSKSTIEASVITWLNTIKSNGKTEVVGGDAGDLSTLSGLLRMGLTDIHPAFYIPKNKNDWEKEIELGLKNKNNESIVHSTIIIKNAEKGKESSSEKGAGLSPVGFIIDEFGKFDFLSFFQGAIPSFETAYGWKCVPILAGTGGNEKLSVDANRLLSNPEAYNIIPMDYESLENRIPDKSLVTWKRTKFGIFVPAQMSYKTGIKKDDTTLADYLGKPEDEELKKIDIKVTNWETSLKVIKKSRELLSVDKIALNKEQMYYPLDPEECFLNRIDNPFPAKRASKHKKWLIEEGRTGKTVEIYKKADGTLGYDLSDLPLAPYPFDGGLHDAPVLLFDDPPKEIPFRGLNVSGLDPYKQTQSTTDSLGSIYVLRREGAVLNDPMAGKILASYTSRPPIPDNFDRTCMWLIEGFGAECLMENADIGFIRYLERQQKAHKLLVEGVDFALSINPNTKQSTKYGLYPTEKNKAHIIKRVLNYCNEAVTVGYEDDGTPITDLGVVRINDIYLLDEIINYRVGGNFDRMVAFGHALAWAEYLDEMNVTYQSPERRREMRERKKKLRIDGVYNTKRLGPY